MELKAVVAELSDFLKKNPDLAGKHVFLWDEVGQCYVGFDNLLKYHKKGYVDAGDDESPQLSEDEVFYTVKDYKECMSEPSITKKDLSQIVLL